MQDYPTRWKLDGRRGGGRVAARGFETHVAPTCSDNSHPPTGEVPD